MVNPDPEGLGIVFESIPHIRFADPTWLALLLVLPLVVWYARRSMAGLGRFRATTAVATRILVTSLLVAAMARAELVLIRNDMAVAYVVDRSLSIPAATQQQALDFVAASQKNRPKSDKIALITFGRNAAIDQPFMQGNLETVNVKSIVDAAHTNVSAAIRAAAAAMPQAGRKRIVLLSDGNENDGAAISEAASAKSSGVRIDCLPIRYGYSREVMIEKLVTPNEVAAGKTASIRIVARAFTGGPAKLRLFADGQQIAVTDVTLKPGANVFEMQQVLKDSHVYQFKATIESPDDSLYQNNAATSFTIVRGEKKVLIVEGKQGDGGTLGDALRDEKVAVDVVAANAIPQPVALMTSYDTVILVNVAAYDLRPDMIKVLSAAVRDYGVGLVMVGGEDSFGAGGWRGTPVEDALPVDMDIKDRQVIPTGALVVIMHTCEFPAGNRWGIDIAKAAVDTLGNYDEFGLLYYGAGEQWLVPLSPVTDRARIKNIINTMQAGDMPDFEPTIRMADAALGKSQASVKHMVIISDGDPQAPSPAVMQSIVSKGITISTVAVFPHDGFSSGTLQAIAKVGKGRYYCPSKAEELPQIFIKEARTVRRGLICENAFKPSLVQQSVPVTGFKTADFPILKGYVITSPKPLAELPLLAANGDPLLAHWQYGLGRSAAFTSDAKAKWASNWVSWDQYRRFWGQVVEWVERKTQNSDFSTSCTVRSDETTVAIDAVGKKGDFINFVQFGGTVLDPSGGSAPLKLEQTAPGHYEGDFKSDVVGTYLPIINYKDSEGALHTYTTAVTVPFSPEYRALSTNDVLLKQVADVTGGKVIGLNENVFRRDFPPEASYTDIWQWMLGSAIALFLFDVFVRRVIIDWAAAGHRALDMLWWVPGIGSRRKTVAERSAYATQLLTAKKSAAKAKRGAAAKKFTPDANAPAQGIEELAREQAISRARAAQEKSKTAETPTKEVAKGAQEGFTARLLEAKRRAQQEKKEGGPPA